MHAMLDWNFEKLACSLTITLPDTVWQNSIYIAKYNIDGRIKIS